MNRIDLSRHLLNARQIAAVSTAFALPLSTSGQAIGVGVLIVLCLLTLDRDRFVATMRRPAAYLPVALVIMMLIGVGWSILPLSGAIKWVGPYAKLLLIPLLLATSFTQRQVLHVGIGFLCGCFIVLVLSYMSILWPTGPWGHFMSVGVPVKDNAVQSEVFALCTFGLLVGVHWLLQRGERKRAMALAVLALAFFVNIFVLPLISRTGALVAISLLALLTIRLAGWRRALLIGLPVIMMAGVGLSALPKVKNRVNEIALGFSTPNDAEALSTASRLDFWTKAKEFVQAAPLLGHGTGSIRPLFQSREAIAPSPYGEAVADPHNQFLHTTLQVGLVGGLILLAMWASHAALFFGWNTISTFGLAIVWMNVLGSLFNSHISQVTQGMLYCMAVGILGALVPAERLSKAPSDRALDRNRLDQTTA